MRPLILRRARATVAGDLRATRRRVVLAGLVCFAVAACLASIAIGPVPLSLQQVLAVLLEAGGLATPWTVSQADEAVVMAIRLPRTATGLAVGAALAVSGAALQGLFRNPLADPGLIGVSSGAALAAVSVIVLGSSLGLASVAWIGPWVLPLAAFAGGLVATLVVFRVASAGGRVLVATLLLAGIAIGAIAGAGIGMLVFVADDEQLRTLNFWMLGSLADSTWEMLLPALPFLLVPVVGIPLLATGLNLMLLGESEAGHLGLEVERFKRWLVVLVALATGAAVAVSGIIAFVGLVVPHILRLSIGPDHRYLLPGSALLGGGLLLTADIAARMIVSPAELPIGILTTLIGGPFFLWLLIRFRARAPL